MTLDALVEFARSLWVLWLMAIFLGIVAWVMWPKRRRKMEQHAQIPLKDEDL